MNRFRFCYILLLSSIFFSANAQQADKFKLFFEKVYLHTDREQYLSGEDIWFKAYLVNGQTNRLINSSNTLYVELINPESKIADRKIIRLDNGLGNGDFKLGDSIPAGVYQIRAYTNWMRNFSDNFVFKKEIQVYGEQDELTSETVEKKKSISNTDGSIDKTTRIKSSEKTIRFFPEGGSMLESVAGVVAFKAEDAAGNGIPVKGRIETLSGQMITEINSSDGTGSFMLTPMPGQKYLAKVNYGNGRTGTAPLPQTLMQGVSLHVIKNQDSLLSVLVSMNQVTLNELQGNPIFLTGKSHGKTCYTTKILVSGLQTLINIPTGNFPAGIANLTLIDNQGRPQAERLVFIEEKEKINLAITTDKSSYQPKEKATVTIKVTGKNQGSVKANLSLAVVDAGIVAENADNISSYLLLGSELRGNIEHPAQYFDENNPMRKRQLDLLLLTQGWRDFIWKRLADSALRISYIPEKGITISGRLKKIWTNNPIPNATITLAAWGAEGDKLFSSTTDSAGRFFLDGVKLFGNQQLDITSTDSKGKKLGYIIVDTATISMYPVKKRLQANTDTTGRLSVFEEEAQQRAALAKKVNLSDTVQLKAVTIKQWSLLSDSTFIIKRADYQYKYLRDYMLAKIPGAERHPDYPERVIFYGMTPVSGKWGPREPLFSIKSPDAKRVSPIQYYNINITKRPFLTIPMDKIISVRLVHYRNRDGIIDRADGTLGDFFDIFLKVKPHAFDRQGFQTINLDIDGYYQARTFYAPKYETPNSKTDLRTTIHWEPNITTSENGEATITYYNADQKTKVRIVAGGITDNGTPITASVVYEVK